MPDANVVTLQIGSAGDLVQGNIVVDYANNTISGTGLNVNVGGNLIGLGGLVLTDNGDGTYTIAGATAAIAGVPLTSVNLSLGSQSPSSLTAAVTTAGITNTQTEVVLAGLVCYVAGTLIRTTKGDIKIEELVVGDLAVTASGEERPIKWTGHNVIDCRDHPRPNEVMPVCVSANAFGEGRPSQDLFVSPGHSLCLDILGEVLIPASALVNSATITQVERETVDYWHVELDSHDIVVANGMPAESYLEMGNRSFFGGDPNSGIELSNGLIAVTPTHENFCRPFVSAGPLVDVVRDRLRLRALAQGWRIEESKFTDLHIVVDGVTIKSDLEGLSARFVVPASAEEVWLVSKTSIPWHVCDLRDVRALGVAVQALTIDDGLACRRTVSLDDPLLCVGFHALEDGRFRWTAGSARIPAALWEGCRGQFFLRVDLAHPAMPRWVPPPDVSILPRLPKAA